jgi:hypothetical protein
MLVKPEVYGRLRCNIKFVSDSLCLDQRLYSSGIYRGKFIDFWKVEKAVEEPSIVMLRLRKVVFLEGSSNSHSREPQLFSSDLNLFHVS